MVMDYEGSSSEKWHHVVWQSGGSTCPPNYMLSHPRWQ